MKKLLFAEQFYYPDAWGGVELPKAVTAMFAEAGYDVQVICGSDQYVEVGDDGDSGFDPTGSGVKITRVPRLLGGRIHQRKFFKQLWFCIAFLPMALLRRRPDAVIVQTNPPLIVVMARIVTLLIRRPLIIIAQDVYPEMLLAHGSLKTRSTAYRVLKAIFAWAYRGAATVITLGPVMSSRIVDKGVDADRIAQISNWATGELGKDSAGAKQMRARFNISDNPVLMYSGNLGIGHEFETLIAGFKTALAAIPDLILVIVGRGSRFDEVQRLIDQFEVTDNVRLSDFVPLEQLPSSLGMADLAVVTLRPGFEGLITPSKALGYLARGLPVLYVGPESDISVLIDEAECGVVCQNGDVNKVARALQDLFSNPDALRTLSANGQSFYAAKLTMQTAMKAYRDVISDVLQR